jgi:hypothetical protein
MRAPNVSRLPFLMAVALVAAAIADPMVETIANTGVLGRGYADNDHSSVIPTLIIGGILALLVLSTRAWGLALARRVAERSPHDDLPYILVLQFVTLFGMESAEQLLDGGRLLGGLVWLGGPAWFSVLVHVTIGILCTFLISRSIRALARHCAAFVSIALEFILCMRRHVTATRFTQRRDDATCRNAAQVCVRQTGERAPPLLLAKPT